MIPDEKQKVNYIQHLLGISEKFNVDNRLSALHISLYYSLFQNWNLSKFRNPISICREELMQSSKIGSTNTYTKCLRELDSWGYLKYMPSFNPNKGSKIYLYTFNKGSDKGSDKALAKVVIPSINSLNNTNNLNSLNLDEQAQKKYSKKLISDDNLKNNSKELQSQKEKSLRQKRKIPMLEEIKSYFTEKQWLTIEAEKFYNYFESNGWLVGGKTPMQNWQAAAHNWILNSNKFSTEIKSRAGKLQTHGNKDYAEPL